MNLPMPLLALLVSNRQGDAPPDAARAALLSMTIRPPIMGLLLAMEMTKQATSVLTEPVVRRALKGLSRKDARHFKQLEDSVWELHRAVDEVRDSLAFTGKSGSSPSAPRGSKRKGKRSL